MTWWQAMILGIVEGVTEYIPVSSTGHLILTAWLLGLSDDPQRWQATSTFNIVIQSGAILAVLGLYRNRVMQMVRGILGRDADGRRLAQNIVLAFLPAAALGPLLSEPIEEYLFRPWPVVGALFAGAWLMIAVGYGRHVMHSEHKGKGLDDVTWQIALLIGAGQCLAMWPGTSRSMITIVAALMLGLRPRAAAEFSFLLGLVTLTAATGYKTVFGGAQMFEHITASSFAIGLAASTVSAAIAVRWFVAFLTRHGVAPFGWYRLGIAVLLALMLALGYLSFPVFEEAPSIVAG